MRSFNIATLTTVIALTFSCSNGDGAQVAGTGAVGGSGPDKETSTGGSVSAVPKTKGDGGSDSMQDPIVEGECDSGDPSVGTDTTACGATIELPGDGSEAHPFELASYEDLLVLSAFVNTGGEHGGCHFSLVHAIDASASSDECSSGEGDGCYQPIGSGAQAFEGNFHGRNCPISHLHYENGETGDQAVGFFASIDAASAPTSLLIEDLRLSSANISAKLAGSGADVGLLAGRITGSESSEVVVRGASIEGTLQVSGSGTIAVGALAGTASHGIFQDIGSSAEIDVQISDDNSETSGRVFSYVEPVVGGVIGDLSDSDLSRAVVLGKLSVAGNADSHGSSVNDTTLSARAEPVIGGAVGQAESSAISEVVVSASIESQVTTSIADSDWSNTTTGEGYYDVYARVWQMTGGIIGKAELGSSASHCVFAGEISVLVDGDSSGSSFTVATEGGGHVGTNVGIAAGGIVGWGGDSVIEECLSMGSVDITSTVDSSDITLASPNTDSIAVDAQLLLYVGGIVGSARPALVVRHVLSTGTLETTSSARRVGATEDGEVLSDSTYHRIWSAHLIGWTRLTPEVTFENSAYLAMESSELTGLGNGQPDTDWTNIKSLETADLPVASTFESLGFDFDADWHMASEGTTSYSSGGLTAVINLPAPAMPVPKPAP